MKYKGFEIKPVYHMNLKELKDGRVVECRPTKEHLSHYEILDPMENNKRWMAEKTIGDCKHEIDRFLLSVKMEDNTPASWKKLDGWQDLDYFKGKV